MTSPNERTGRMQLTLFPSEQDREQRLEDARDDYIRFHESYADMDDYYNDEEGY